jgi:RHS repeat-associated protein
LSLRAAAKYEESKSILLKNNKLSSFKAKDLLPVLAVTPVSFGNSETKSYAVGVNILGLVPITKKIVNVIKTPIITPKKLQNAVIEISFYKDSLLQEQIFSKQIPVSENAAYDWEVLKDSLIFNESGFAVVSLRNSNSLPVLFDNLELKVYGTEKAVIIQENHYEPFGMTLKGLDYVVNEKQTNNFLFNGGVERQTELDLYWDDSHARGYDPQKGSFNQIDPLTDKYTSITGYNYSFNNPANLNDPSGLEPETHEQWVARIQSEWARIDAGEDPFVVWGMSGRGQTKQSKAKPTIYVYGVSYQTNQYNADGTTSSSVTSISYQQLKRIGKYIGSIFQRNGIGVSIKLITAVQAEGIRDKLSPTSAMIGISDEPGGLGGRTLMTLNQGKESIKGDEYVNLNSSIAFLDRDGDYAVAYSAAHEVWHQWTQKAAFYTDKNPIYKEFGAGTGAMWYVRQDFYFGNFHFSAYPNLNAEGGSHPHPKTPNTTAELVIPQQKELVLKFFNQYGK